ncbi:MAG TPA: right-handed parallel beta-helix repeat-containing protein [Candidatus Hydrogenedentes bacterium]|nr:right-handed parallel beta-helix repeat-containing protein [Candidatus Hydrogenedentota bacterium]HPG68966.1 right-handed parallel beta-helix repeat-containing protein [Candidatus Hydrogenedentota bacterium]
MSHSFNGRALAMLLALASVGYAGETAFYVDQTGDDNACGSEAEPFATLEAARDAIRGLKQVAPLSEPVTVYVRGGIHYRTATFTLGEEDSGSVRAPITYRSYPGEDVHVVGGVRLDPAWFGPVRDAAILDRLDASARDKVVCADLKPHGIEDYGALSIQSPMIELFCHGQRLPIARYPNEGWMHIGKVVGVDPNGRRTLTDGNKQGTTFRYLDDRPARWIDARDATLHGFWWFGWTDEFATIERIDAQRAEITLDHVPGGGIREEQWFYALDLLEEIDTPGEWYLDRQAGTLYLWPPEACPAEPLYASMLAEPLVAMDGVSHVTVRGMTFEVTRGLGILLCGGTQSRIAGCVVRGIGSTGVHMDGGTRNGLLSCDIYATGTMGVHLRGGNRYTLEPSGNYIVNNHIHHYAQRKKVYQPAVRLYGCGHRVAHNHIHDAPHQAIGYDGNEHVIEFNDIHDVVLESADAGVLYTGCNWTFRGNIVRHNFIHNIPHGPGLGSVGIYLDDCCSSTDMIGNVFYDMLKPTFIGGGRDNRVENNLYIECDFPLYLDNRGLRWEHFRPGGPMYDQLKEIHHDQPPYSVRYPALARILDETPQAPLGNTFINNLVYRCEWHDPEAYCRETSGNHIDQPYLRQENNWITDDDPGFLDAAALNFQLRDEAPAFVHIPGFRPIPFHQVGIYPDSFRAELPE